MNTFMEHAVDLAANNVRQGGQPFGAVLVKDDLVVAEGVNELHMKYDVTGHAELLAIRSAQEDYQTNDLSGFIMYASGEPCPMCLTAMYFAGISDVYYCASIEDATAIGLEKSENIYHELKKLKQERSLQMVRIPLQERQENPLALWKERDGTNMK